MQWMYVPMRCKGYSISITGMSTRIAVFKYCYLLETEHFGSIRNKKGIAISFMISVISQYLIKQSSSKDS
ncbi:hypothetical protein V1477_004522 [Vespula maculifrons]|uniref:Uncharacterized protein n=1 Tax=Vespula maculifrons TaxID=7453 RepID=A0ABD2CM39_VESMC